MRKHISTLLGEHPRIVNIFSGPVTVHYREVSLYIQEINIYKMSATVQVTIIYNTGHTDTGADRNN